MLESGGLRPSSRGPTALKHGESSGIDAGVARPTGAGGCWAGRRRCGPASASRSTASALESGRGSRTAAGRSSGPSWSRISAERRRSRRSKARSMTSGFGTPSASAARRLTPAPDAPVLGLVPPARTSGASTATALDASANVRVLLQRDRDRDRDRTPAGNASTASGHDAGGKQTDRKGARCVLCSGGIENARLLLQRLRADRKPARRRRAVLPGPPQRHCAAIVEGNVGRLQELYGLLYAAGSATCRGSC